MHALAAAEGVNSDFNATDSHVRCFAHVLHLAVKAGLDQLQLPDVDLEEMAAATAADGSPVKKVSSWSLHICMKH